MKWLIIVILLTSVALLGCTPTPKSETNAAGNTEESISFNDAMASFDTSEWLTDYSKALGYAKEMKRPVLVDFTGSDWCGWCIKLDGEVFSKEAFSKYAKENLILLKLDFPRKKAQSAEEKAANEKLAQQFAVTGFPTILLLNSEGVEIARTGYQPGGADAYVAHLQSLLKPKK